MSKPSEAATDAAGKIGACLNIFDDRRRQAFAIIIDAAADEKYKPLVEAVESFLAGKTGVDLRQALRRVKGE